MTIISPCISVCVSDPKTDYCYGCGRTSEEKIHWKEEATSDSWKKENLKIILRRLSGWQQEAFIEAYNYKKKNGISRLKELKLKKLNLS